MRSWPNRRHPGPARSRALSAAGGTHRRRVGGFATAPRPASPSRPAGGARRADSASGRHTSSSSPYSTASAAPKKRPRSRSAPTSSAGLPDRRAHPLAEAPALGGAQLGPLGHVAHVRLHVGRRLRRARSGCWAWRRGARTRRARRRRRRRPGPGTRPAPARPSARSRPSASAPAPGSASPQSMRSVTGSSPSASSVISSAETRVTVGVVERAVQQHDPLLHQPAGQDARTARCRSGAARRRRHPGHTRHARQRPAIPAARLPGCGSHGHSGRPAAASRRFDHPCSILHSSRAPSAMV